MQNSREILLIVLLLFSLTSIGLVLNSVNATQSDLPGYKNAFGPLVGLTANDTGSVDWLMSGTWRSTLPSDSNENSTIPALSAAVFTAAIEMIKPDGNGRHTHALTNFVVDNTMKNPDNNSTIYNGTSTISLLESPAANVPTTVEKSSNGNVYKITIDPESVNHHFGKLPFLYGISTNHEFMKSPPTG